MAKLAHRLCLFSYYVVGLFWHRPWHYHKPLSPIPAPILESHDGFYVRQAHNYLCHTLFGMVVLSNSIDCFHGNNNNNTGSINYTMYIFWYKNTVWNTVELGLLFSWCFTVTTATTGIASIATIGQIFDTQKEFIPCHRMPSLLALTLTLFINLLQNFQISWQFL